MGSTPRTKHSGYSERREAQSLEFSNFDIKVYFTIFAVLRLLSYQTIHIVHDGKYWLVAESKIMWPDAYMKN